MLMLDCKSGRGKDYSAFTYKCDFNNAEEGVVKPLQSDVIQKLLCGQTVISLSDACKELLENSLDAGATNIEVLVEDYGADCLQVSDNGRGIAAKDFDLICKSSCTSKLSSLEDLSRLSSFGFRGQALCALSLLSNITVTTRGALEPVGHTLEFDHSGNVTKKVACARQVGTTVTCRNCFESFPVRRKQLLRNLKKEFSKLVDLIRSYALLPQDVTLSVVNVKNGKRTKEFSANCCNSIKENIWEVFGLSFFQTLVELVQMPPTENTLNDCKVRDKDLSCINEINISGYVSSIHQGRASKDRQFLFVNNRPCELKLISNAVNEVYRRFNGTQYPAFFIHITVPLGFCDVNCTPDKRTILLAKGNLLEAIVRQSLLSAFEQTTVVSSCSKLNFANTDVQSSQSDQPKRSRLDETASQDDSPKESITLALDYGRSDKPVMSFVRHSAGEVGQLAAPSSSLYSYGFNNKCKKSETVAQAKVSPPTSPPSPLEFDGCSSKTEPSCDSINLGTKRLRSVTASNELPISKGAVDVRSFEVSPMAEVEPVEESSPDLADPLVESDKVNVRTADGSLLKRTVHTVVVDWEHVKKETKSRHEEESFEQPVSSEGSVASSQDSETTNEVSRMLRRSAFAEMDIVGQFNLGFIITRFGDDLFIIDQHASDERYNYEMLQKTALVESQRLVCPIPLEVSAYHREVIMQNLDKFVKNGFAIDLDDDSDTSVTITAVPTCYGKTFDRQDFDDLVERFSKAPSLMHRPAKLRDIFASKACRKSVMIGTALRHDEMKRRIMSAYRFELKLFSISDFEELVHNRSSMGWAIALFSLLPEMMNAQSGVRCPHDIPKAQRYGYKYGIYNGNHSSCLTLVTNARNKKEWFEDDAITAGVMLCKKYFPGGLLSLDWNGPLQESAAEIAKQSADINLLIGGIVRKQLENGKLELSDENEQTFTVDGDRAREVSRAAKAHNLSAPFCLSGRYSVEKSKLVYEKAFLCDDHKQWTWNSVICVNRGFRNCSTLGAATGCVYSTSQKRCCQLRPYERENSHPMEEILFPCRNRSYEDCSKQCEGYGNLQLSQLTQRVRTESSACGKVEIRTVFVPQDDLTRDCDTSLCCSTISSETKGECPCKAIKLCKNGGKCVDDDDVDKWHCECMEGFMGEFCEKRTRIRNEDYEADETEEERNTLKLAAAGTVVAFVSFSVFGCIAYQVGHTLGMSAG
ncbi:hypothetical protein M514_02930 [Trichuris suis]|uniref:EGF-like domain-containing protein n=1 Tax=Trichuris suis TaxID=68888 RepID=A0A085NB31_9BILA|nr:hypothetical protein M514_02930 [Trichuris suis]